MEEVKAVIHKNGIGQITLNRPQALNSLNLTMLQKMKETLLAWQDDENVLAVLLDGAGEKGFCAGGDVKMLYTAKESEEHKNAARTFFDVEYEVDLLVHQYEKPIIAILNGIVMGGGVGLSHGASHRVITEKTKWAMPEMNIGFFPDVGAAYFLNKAPGYLGRYVALKAEVLTKEDVLYIGAADECIPDALVADLIVSILEKEWPPQNLHPMISEHLQRFTSSDLQKPASLAEHQEKIDRHFCHPTVEAIIDSLSKDGDAFSIRSRDTILSKSPLSVKVTLEQLRRGEGKSLAACLEMDKRIANRFLEEHDFYEGVRSTLIDKDHSPNYKYKQLSDVTDSFVASFFS